MKLTAYLHPGWRPYIRPAPSTRNWMDATPEAFAYRCLPLNIANAHGWELLNPSAFEAIWTDRAAAERVRQAARGEAGVRGTCERRATRSRDWPVHLARAEATNSPGCTRNGRRTAGQAPRGGPEQNL